MKSTKANQIWNRAALGAGGYSPLEGDRALTDLLLAHSLAMNGDVGHMIEALDDDELSAAIKGFRYFGFEAVARLLENFVDASESEQERADTEYNTLIDDRAIAQRFEDYYERDPNAFAPVDL